MAYTYDVATAVTSDGPGSYRLSIQEGWDHFGAANGGLVMALATRAMANEVGPPDPVTITGHYLKAVATGEALVEVEVIRSAARHSTAFATFRQGEGTCAVFLATFGDLAETDVDLQDGAPPDFPPPDACVGAQVAGVDDVAVPAWTAHLDLRIPPDLAGFATGSPSGRGEAGGWIRFADGRPPDAGCLPLLADAFPPAVLNTGLSIGRVPTMELTVHVRRRPEPGWLLGTFRTRFMSGGYLEEDGELWDPAGHVVALSRQLARAPRRRSKEADNETAHGEQV
ncbi:MAG TPA: thioesterase family protein [Acidimicrobiia bacterium]